jgi:hypothetical protein
LKIRSGSTPGRIKPLAGVKIQRRGNEAYGSFSSLLA